MAMIQTFPTRSGNGSGGSITILGCFNTAPATFVQGDIYYNTTDGLIYTSADGTTWGTGTTPKEDVLYISLDDHKIYSYTNNAFEIYGGNVEISKEPFNTLSEKSDGLYAEPKGLGAAYRKETIIYDNSSLSTVKSNDILTLSDDITNYDSIFICTGSDINNADTRKIHEVKLNDVDYVNDNQYKYGLDFCYNTTYYYSIRFKFTDSKSIKISSVIVGGWTGTTIIQIVGVKYTTDVSQLVDSSKAIEDTPVGHIISTMANNAPKHYLVCDGTEYNISDYPYLAQHFQAEFGAIDYFGGDGVTTFAVPDLRGEFLRGTGTNSHANQGDGAAVSVHQDGTEFPQICVYDGTFQYIMDEDGGSGYNTPQKTDKSFGTRKSSRYTNVGTLDDDDYENSLKYTARPTNTSVLYCIKAEPTYYMELNQAAYINQYCDTYNTNEIVIGKDFNGKPIYRKVVELNKSYADGTDTLIATIANADTFIRIDAYLIWSDGSKQMVCSSGADDVSLYLTSNNELRFYNHTKYAINCKYAILEYTKSTDAVNSFDYGMIIDQFAQEALLDVAVTDAEVDRCFE